MTDPERISVPLNDELRALREIGKALTSTRGFDEFQKQIMELVGRLFHPLNWSLLLVDEEKNDIYFSIAVGSAGAELKNKRLPPGKGIVGWSIAHGEAVISTDVRKDDRFYKELDAELGFRTDSVICMPLISKERVLGALELINVESRYFDPISLELLAALVDFAAIAVENANHLKRIEELTIRDDCTHLYNARHMRTLLDAEISRSRRSKIPFSIVFIDLDHFKEVNDTRGHLTGSRLLRDVAILFTTLIRPTDWAIRYGGDEFVIILSTAGPDEAALVAERLRRGLADKVFFEKEGFSIRLSGSFGVAVYPNDADSLDGLIKLADDAMYEVKKRGRNSVLMIKDILSRGGINEKGIGG